MLKRIMTIGFVFLLLGWGLSAGELQAAGSSNGLNGTLYIVDATGHTVTLKDANGTATVLNVTRKTKIVRYNKKTNLAGLVLGDQIAAVFDNSNNAKQLTATGPVVSTISGGVNNVTSGTGIVSIQKSKLRKDAKTSVQTRVVRNGEITSLKSLTRLDRITAHLVKGGSLSPASHGTDDAVDIQAEGPEESELKGTIAAVDVQAMTVTITPKVGGPDVTINVTADTLIEVDGEFESDSEGGQTGGPATINDLVVGLLVEAVYDPVTLNAFRIEAEHEEEEAVAEGPITAIDAVPGTVTVDCCGTPVTLIVNASTKIRRDDEPATLSDLQIGDEVHAEYNTVTMIAKEIRAGTQDEDEGGEDEGDGNEGQGGEGGQDGQGEVD
jgi:Cu/Ag efflux protein CusF